MHIYRPQTKLREGNVFTGVYLSTGGVDMSRGGGFVLGGGYVRVVVSTPPHSRYMRSGILRDRVDKRTVRILLECSLVTSVFTQTVW